MKMKPHNHTILTMPFRKSWGPFSFTRNRKVGFIFDNYVNHAVFIESGCKDAKEYNEWGKLDNGALRNFMYIYCAAVRYCEVNRIKDNFDRVSLKRALSEIKQSEIDKLTACINNSESFGATYKKKVTEQAKR